MSNLAAVSDMLVHCRGNPVHVKFGPSFSKYTPHLCCVNGMRAVLEVRYSRRLDVLMSNLATVFDMYARLWIVYYPRK